MKRPISAAAACAAIAPALLALSASPASAAGSVALTAVDTAYTQDFDTLATSGTANTALPEGWWLAESGTSALNNGAYAAGTGSGTSGDTYSFGTGADRAFGTLLSSSLVPTIGASFTNSTDRTITSLDVTLNGEQWRLGSVTRTAGDTVDRLDAAVSTDATGLTTGTWAPVDDLDVRSAATTGTVGALDGNTTRTTVSGSVTDLAVAPGETVWLRWSDYNVSSSDDGLAVDDVSVTPRAGDITPPPPDPVCGDTATPVHEVQGSGSATPVTDEVQVEGVVVSDLQAAGSFDGFYLQEEDADADADPATSEGVFVYAPGGTDVAVGDRVRVTGTPTEYQGLTEIASIRDVRVCATGHSADVTPTDVSFPATDAERETVEGMRVRVAQRMTVTEVFTLARYGEVVLASGGRLMTPTAVVEPGAEATALQAANDRRRVVLDDGSNRQNLDPTAWPQGGLSAANTLRVGDSTDDLAGVVDYRFGTWRVQPAGPGNDPSISFDHTNPRTAGPDAVGGDVRVASFNVLNYFNGQPAGNFADPDNRGADNQAELDRQTAKEVAAITRLDADVVGLMELENDPSDGTPAIEQLVDAINADGSAGTYDYVDTGVIGTDAIRVGLLYRPARVTPVGDHAILDSSVDPRFVDTLNRPSLAQTFAAAGEPGGDRFTVVVNHLKSKGSDCNAVGDPDTGDGSGNCNLTRTAAAEAVADWVHSDPTGSGDPDALVIGDLNSYAKEDPVDAFRDAGFVDQVAAYVGPGAYSYVFGGQSGYLDHALATPGLDVTGVTEWHVNADEPIALDYNLEFKSAGQQQSFYAPDAYRSSDHDPVLVGVDLDSAPVVDAGGPYRVKVNRSVTLRATGSDADGDAITYAWDLDGDGTFETPGQQVTFDARKLKKGTYPVAVRATAGGAAATDSTVVVVASK